MQSFFDISEYVGRNIILAVSDTGYILLIFFQSVFYSKDVFRRWREIAKQMYVAGVKSFVVSSIVSFFTGMVLTLQTGLELMTFQQEALVGDLVITVMTREMGPFTAALVLTAFMREPSGKPKAEKPEFIRKGYEFLLKSAKPDGGIYNKGLSNYNTSVALMALLGTGDPADEPLLTAARKFVGQQQAQNMAKPETNGGFGDRTEWFYLQTTRKF